MSGEVGRFQRNGLARESKCETWICKDAKRTPRRPQDPTESEKGAKQFLTVNTLVLCIPPKPDCMCDRVKPLFLPPPLLVSDAVKGPVMSRTEWYGPFIADFTPQRTWLGKA